MVELEFDYSKIFTVKHVVKGVSHVVYVLDPHF